MDGWLKRNRILLLFTAVSLIVLYEALTNCGWLGCPGVLHRFSPFNP